MRRAAVIALVLALAAARSPDAVAEALLKSALLPPVLSACISSAFGPRVLPNQPEAGTYHYGIDLPAPAGAAVVAAAPGSVIRIQRKGPGGLEMLVQHEGFVGIYSHFGSIAPPFAEGKRTVAAGEKLGVVGRTGVTSGAHLYFEMILDGKPVDPAPYLRVPRCGGNQLPTTADADVADGTTYGGRKYFQILLPDRQFYDWHKQQQGQTAERP
jgi:murein DD-endopeptidase MepM/ murein hydrolase activator NlpD